MKGSLKDVSLVLREKKKKKYARRKILEKEKGKRKKKKESTIDRQDLSVSVCP